MLWLVLGKRLLQSLPKTLTQKPQIKQLKTTHARRRRCIDRKKNYADGTATGTVVSRQVLY